MSIVRKSDLRTWDYGTSFLIPGNHSVSQSTEWMLTQSKSLGFQPKLIIQAMKGFGNRNVYFKRSWFSVNEKLDMDRRKSGFLIPIVENLKHPLIISGKCIAVTRARSGEKRESARGLWSSPEQKEQWKHKSVSYTHLTLPTKRIV